MRLQVMDKNGIEYGGRRYAEGEEFETEDTSRGRAWSAAFIAQRRARKFEPVLVGTPTPAPKPAPVGTPPASTPPTPPEPAPAAPEQKSEPEITPSVAPPQFQTDEDAADSESSDDEPETADRPRRGRPPIHGRYSRRDVRPEE